jgi:hypothetical protein
VLKNLEDPQVRVFLESLTNYYYLKDSSSQNYFEPFQLSVVIKKLFLLKFFTQFMPDIQRAYQE